MEIAQIRGKCAAGQISEAVVEPAETGNGWRVAFITTAGTLEPLTDHSGEIKLYHSLDQATAAARDVGFASVRVEERF